MHNALLAKLVYWWAFFSPSGIEPMITGIEPFICVPLGYSKPLFPAPRVSKNPKGVVALHREHCAEETMICMVVKTLQYALNMQKNTSKSWEKTKWQVHQYQSNLFVKAIREGVGVTIYVKIAKKGWKGSVTSIPSVMRDCGMVSLQFVWIFLAKKPKEKIFINNYIKGGRLSRKRKSFKWEFSLYPHTCKNARTLSVLFSGLLY